MAVRAIPVRPRYYEVYVPPGLPELNASVSSNSSANTFVADLIDPVTGQAASTATNDFVGSGGTMTPETGAQLHVLKPDPGLWTIAVDFYGQVSGTAISQPFNITLSRIPVPAGATLPDLCKHEARCRDTGDRAGQGDEHRKHARVVLRRRPPRPRHADQPGAGDDVPDDGADLEPEHPAVRGSDPYDVGHRQRHRAGTDLLRLLGRVG